jgi:hypothetical protein
MMIPPAFFLISRGYRASVLEITVRCPQTMAHIRLSDLRPNMAIELVVVVHPQHMGSFCNTPTGKRNVESGKNNIFLPLLLFNDSQSFLQASIHSLTRQSEAIRG